MTTHILVREDREGRQYEEETVHCVKKGEGETVCGSFSSDQTRVVKNLGVFVGKSPICSECAESIKEHLS